MPRSAGGSVDAGARPAPDVSAGGDSRRGGVLSLPMRQSGGGDRATAQGAAKAGRVSAGMGGDRYGPFVPGGAGGAGAGGERRRGGGIPAHLPFEEDGILFEYVTVDELADIVLVLRR